MYEESIRELAEKLSLRDVAILVTGATGLIGSCIIDVLSIANIELGANIKIYALSRNKEKLKKDLELMLYLSYRILLNR